MYGLEHSLWLLGGEQVDRGDVRRPGTWRPVHLVAGMRMGERNQKFVFIIVCMSRHVRLNTGALGGSGSLELGFLKLELQAVVNHPT